METINENLSKVFDVRIGGVALKLKTAHERATVDQLVEYVDDQMSQALSSTKSGSLRTAAILAALNIAEENLSFKKRVGRNLDGIETKARKVLSRFESAKISKAGVKP